MHIFKSLAIISSLVIIIGSLGYQYHYASRALPKSDNHPAQLALINGRESSNESSSMLAGQRYILDASQSKFIAHALAGGLLWFKGHDHLVAVRDFTGEAQLDPAALSASSLQINAKTASMVETSSVFTDQQKQIINKELREI